MTLLNELLRKPLSEGDSNTLELDVDQGLEDAVDGGGADDVEWNVDQGFGQALTIKLHRSICPRHYLSAHNGTSSACTFWILYHQMRQSLQDVVEIRGKENPDWARTPNVFVELHKQQMV